MLSKIMNCKCRVNYYINEENELSIYGKYQGVQMFSEHHIMLEFLCEKEDGEEILVLIPMERILSIEFEETKNDKQKSDVSIN